jgi:hypothetical protein
MTGMTRAARAIGLFLLNVVIASIATNVLVAPFARIDVNAIASSILKRDFLNAVAAIALGYFVYHRWQPVSSRWVWLAGIFWFGRRAFAFWLEQRAVSVMYQGHTIYWEMSGAGCNFDMQSCHDWIVYTLPLIRTTFYSAGAFYCSYVRKHGLPRIFSGLPGIGRKNVQ